MDKGFGTFYFTIFDINLGASIAPLVWELAIDIAYGIEKVDTKAAPC
jgi:hypothetical protein